MGPRTSIDAIVRGGRCEPRSAGGPRSRANHARQRTWAATATRAAARGSLGGRVGVGGPRGPTPGPCAIPPAIRAIVAAIAPAVASRNVHRPADVRAIGRPRAGGSRTSLPSPHAPGPLLPLRDRRVRRRLPCAPSRPRALGPPTARRDRLPRRRRRRRGLRFLWGYVVLHATPRPARRRRPALHGHARTAPVHPQPRQAPDRQEQPAQLPALQRARPGRADDRRRAPRRRVRDRGRRQVATPRRRALPRLGRHRRAPGRGRLRPLVPVAGRRARLALLAAVARGRRPPARGRRGRLRTPRVPGVRQALRRGTRGRALLPLLSARTRPRPVRPYARQRARHRGCPGLLRRHDGRDGSRGRRARRPRRPTRDRGGHAAPVHVGQRHPPPHPLDARRARDPWRQTRDERPRDARPADRALAGHDRRRSDLRRPDGPVGPVPDDRPGVRRSPADGAHVRRPRLHGAAAREAARAAPVDLDLLEPTPGPGELPAVPVRPRRALQALRRRDPDEEESLDLALLESDGRAAIEALRVALTSLPAPHAELGGEALRARRRSGGGGETR